MYRISTKSITSRVAVSRGGARLRRLPHVVLATGQSIKIAPGRAVQVTEPVFHANLVLLREFAELIDVIHVATGDAINVLESTSAAQVAVSTSMETLVKEIVVVEPEVIPEIVEDHTLVEEKPVEVEQSVEDIEAIDEPASKNSNPAQPPSTDKEAPKRSRSRKKKKSEDA